MEPSLASAALLGFGFGLRHALDADHLVAVSTMVAGGTRPARAAGIGLLWGTGHAGVVGAVGVILVLLDRGVGSATAAAIEMLAAVALVGLGIRLLLRSRAGVRVHRHRHAHADGLAHSHLHVHATGIGHAHTHGQPGVGAATPRPFLPVAVGMMHGLAGSAALSLLVATAAPRSEQALLFLALFGAGSTLAMTVTSVAMALPFGWAGRVAGLRRWLTVGAGLVSVAVGCRIGWRLTPWAG